MFVDVLGEALLAQGTSHQPRKAPASRDDDLPWYYLLWCGLISIDMGVLADSVFAHAHIIHGGASVGRDQDIVSTLVTEGVGVNGPSGDLESGVIDICPAHVDDHGRAREVTQFPARGSTGWPLCRAPYMAIVDYGQ